MAKAMTIPIIPPDEFVIISVISVAPMAKINCIISSIRLVSIIGIILNIIGFSSHMTWIKTPKGIKANTFWIISSKSNFPFTITDSLKGIKFIFLTGQLKVLY